MDDERASGWLLLGGCTQFILAEALSASMTPGYSYIRDYISDLGIGPGALVFNASMVVMGLCILAASFIMRRRLGSGISLALAVVLGLGIAGVGVFPEDVMPAHLIAALVAFTVGGVAPIYTSRMVDPPLKRVGLAMGILSIASLVWFMAGGGLPSWPLGPGFVERMIVYPLMAWGILMGAQFIRKDNP